jgi:diguanylate cyclase (GGDEF)-like protein
MREAEFAAAPRRWGWIWIATLVGTALCTAIVGWFNTVAGHPGNLLTAALISAPLLFLLATGLRNMASARRAQTISASTDALTGLSTRQAFDAAVHAYFDALRDSGRHSEGALLVIDIDNLKAINDAFDHETGDDAIRTVAGTIRASVRDTDLVGRLGGEEFVILLPGIGQEEAQRIADRICRAVEVTRFSVEDVRHRLTVSIGVGLFRDSATLTELLNAADRALYAAKQYGRNRTAISPVQSPAERMAA